MFFESRPIDPELQEIVNDLENKNSALSVLAARKLYCPLTQNTLEITITKPRKFNILEEFILRASIHLNDSPTENELAEIFDLDIVFVKNICQNLRNLQVLKPTSDIQVTPQGLNLYLQGCVADKITTQEVYFINDLLSNQIILKNSPLISENSDDLYLENIHSFVKFEPNLIDISKLDIEDFRQLLQTHYLALHNPESGRIVTNFKLLKSEIIKQTINILVVFDTVTRVITLQGILDGKQLNINHLLEDKKIDLHKFCKLDDDELQTMCELISQHHNAEVQEIINKLRNQHIEQLSNQQEKTNSITGTVQQIRGATITEEFEKLLEQAKQEIIIYSPWISKNVVNDEFINKLRKIVNKGVWVLIGYGISQTEGGEERKIGIQLINKLKQVMTREKLPGVQILWLGASHAKEVIVDRQIHLNVSNNMLSYQADLKIWDEAGYKVTIPEQVQAAYDFYANRFQKRTDELWLEGMQSNNSELKYQCLCILGALGMEEKALKMLQNHQVLELIPVWLAIVAQGLRTDKIKVNSPIFPLALSLLNQVNDKNTYIQQLRLPWRGIMKEISHKNPQIVSKLVTSEVWEQFQRLQIVDTEESLENFML